MASEVDIVNSCLIKVGEAVAYGMLFVLPLARRRGLPGSDAERIRRLVRRLELPRLPSFRAEQLVGFLGKDKKNREKGLTWVLPEVLGRAGLREDVSMVEIRQELEVFLSQPRSD